jgi:hypothetical protein
MKILSIHAGLLLALFFSREKRQDNSACFARGVRFQ